MKLLAIGLWITLVALGTAYGAAVYLPGMGAPKAAPVAALQYQKLRVLNVPMVFGGTVQGFMEVQLSYTADAGAMKDVRVPPDAYLLDEAFRTVYADPTLDFHNLSRFDLNGFAKRVVSATNDRLGAPVVKDVLIEHFNYIPKETIKR